MEEQKRHIDDLFREGLEGYREMPEASVWNSLEQRLPKNKGGRSFLWLWVLLMLALLSSMGYYANKHFFADNILESEQKREINQVVNDIPSSNKEDKTVVEKTIIEKDSALEKKNKELVINERRKSSSTKKHKSSTNQAATINRRTHHSLRPKSNDDANKESHFTEENKDDNESAKSNKSEALSQERNKKIAGNSKGINNQPSQPTEVNTSSAKNPINVTPDKTEGTITKVASTKNNDQLQTETATNREISKQQKKLDNPPKSSTIPEEGKNKSEVAIISKQASNKEPSSDPKSLNPTNAMRLKEERVTTTPASVNSSKKEQPTLPKLQEDETSKSSTVKKDHKETLPTPAEEEKKKKQEAVDNSKGKPVALKDEATKSKPIGVNKEASQKNPIILQAEPKEKKSKAEITKGILNEESKPVLQEKTYGIKMDDVMTPSEEDGEDEVDNGNGGGSGNSGGAGMSKTKNRNGLKIDGGLKLGYERGFASVTTSAFTGNLLLQWNISPRTSLVVQPGIRYHSINKTSLFPQNSFHQIHSETIDSAHVYQDSFGIPDFFIQRNYIYGSSYDSISVSYAISPQKYIDIELPLLLQYKLAENISILGGIQLAFGKVVQIQSNMQRFQRSNLDTLSFPLTLNDSMSSTPNIPSQYGYFSYSNASINDLDQNKYRNPITNPARFGVMLGFSYEYKRRLLIDLIARKNLSNLNFIPNEEVRKLYSQPYFRISVGYKLFQSK